MDCKLENNIKSYDLFCSMSVLLLFKISESEVWSIKMQPSGFLNHIRKAACVRRLWMPVGTALKWTFAKLETKQKLNIYHTAHLQWFPLQWAIDLILDSGLEAVKSVAHNLASSWLAVNCGIQNDPSDNHGWVQCVLWLYFAHKTGSDCKFAEIALHPGACLTQWISWNVFTCNFIILF